MCLSVVVETNPFSQEAVAEAIPAAEVVLLAGGVGTVLQSGLMTALMDGL